MRNYETVDRDALEDHFDSYFDTRFEVTDTYDQNALLFDWGIIRGLELTHIVSTEFCDYLRKRCSDEFHTRSVIYDDDDDEMEDTI